MQGIGEALLHWYEVEGRLLPWREHRDPYAIWVAEIMLQQTRVEAVQERYRDFLKRFPSVEVLAEADEEEVMALWQGLGYYNRARRLHEASRIMVEKFQGMIPQEYSLFRSLPGVGEYTAAAVLSIAFQKPLLALDGNLLRVGARLFCIEEEIDSSRGKSLIQEAFLPHLPPARAGDFNQAFMDLGALICISPIPRCSQCPVSSFCRAKALEKEKNLPRRRHSRALKPIQIEVFFIQGKDNALLLRRRMKSLFLGGLWELPWQEAYGDGCRVSEKGEEPLVRMEYRFTHRHWHMEVYSGRAEDWLHKEEMYRWVIPDRLEEMPMATVFRKVLELIQKKQCYTSEDKTRDFYSL